MEDITSKNLIAIGLISLGAVLGANVRYWFGVWAGQRWGTTFPYATLFINLSGSFILGLFTALVMQRLMFDPRWRLFFAIGFLGSYTTFSTYTYESVTLLMAGNWAAGLLNLLGSALLGALAAILGVVLGRLI